jgi:hypothetical protein
MMKCDFTQIYAEVGAAFSLSHMLLNPLQQRLDALGKDIPFLAEKLKAEDFVINYIISAKRAIDATYIMGPTYLRKRARVEFSIFIPYRDIADFGERIDYVLGEVAKGIKLVFDKYGVDSSGVDECAQDMIALAKQSPLDYQYPAR